jgi:hypothetical protein
MIKNILFHLLFSVNGTKTGKLSKNFHCNIVLEIIDESLEALNIFVELFNSLILRGLI